MGEWSIKNGRVRRVSTQALHRPARSARLAFGLRCVAVATGVSMGSLLLWGQSAAHAHRGHLGMAEQLVTLAPIRTEVRRFERAQHSGLLDQAAVMTPSGAWSCATGCAGAGLLQRSCLSLDHSQLIGLARSLDHLAKDVPTKRFDDLAPEGSGLANAPLVATEQETTGRAAAPDLVDAGQC